MIASGVRTTEATAGTQQLSQALASGKVQGDEFRSMLENITEVARTAAQGLYEMGNLTKPTIGELIVFEKRRARRRGLLPGGVSQGGKANALFAKMPDTIGRATAGVSNEFSMTGRLGEATGAIDLWIKSLRTLESVMRAISDAMPDAQGMAGGAFDPSRITPSGVAEQRAALTEARQQLESTRQTAQANVAMGITDTVRANALAIRESAEVRRLEGIVSRTETALDARVAQAREGPGAGVAAAAGGDWVWPLPPSPMFSARADATKTTVPPIVPKMKNLAQAREENAQASIRARDEAARLAASRGEAATAAARAEMVTQKQLQAEIAARGQQTEELRIQQRLLEAKEQYGETWLAMMADEIVATERLRTHSNWSSRPST